MLTDKQKAEMLKMVQERRNPDMVDLVQIANKVTRNAEDAFVLADSGLIRDTGGLAGRTCWSLTLAGTNLIELQKQREQNDFGHLRREQLFYKQDVLCKRSFK